MHYLSSHNFKRFKLKKFEEKLCVKLEEMCWKERNRNNRRKGKKEVEERIKKRWNEGNKIRMRGKNELM